MLSSRPKTDRWAALTLCTSGFVGFMISSIIILSLISVYLPDRGSSLIQSTLCQLSFASMISQTTGAGPAALVTADFNKDGFLDLAVANYEEGSTSILLGNGNGAFTQQTKLSNGNNAGPNGIAVGDLTNDQQLDLVVVNSNNSNVGVFFGKSDGSFSLQTTYSTGAGSSPLGVALGDLNRDNILDLVASDNANNNLLLFRGNGDGTFIQIQTLSTGSNSGPYSVIINYFNEDSYYDIAVANSRGNNVGIFLSDGTGNFGGQTTYSTGLGPHTLVTADFNRDGVLDIATANYLGNSTSVLLGNRDGTFRTHKSFSTGAGSLPCSIRSADFNRDSIPDLIVANSGTNNIGILLGYGNGNFRTQKTYASGSQSYPDDVIVGDFNRDNRLDFISANYYNNKVGIFLNTCS